MKLLTFFLILLFFGNAFAQTKVASLHPLLTDIAKQVGGEHVEVIDLLKGASDIHSFSPSAGTLKKANGAVMYLAAGKGMESYLPKLKQIVGGSVEVIEVGKSINSIVIDEDSAHFACCPHHSHGAIDPHWWHSVPNIKKAAKVIAAEFSKMDAANKSVYKENYSNYKKQLDNLDSWVRKEISKIPRSDRYLATSHAAFAYFCKEYGFKSIPVQGVNAESEVTATYLAEASKVLKEKNVKVVFTEAGNNPKELKTIATSSGAKVVGSLYTDSNDSVIGMFQHNVTLIVKNLAQ